jgi:hypothetical protein
VLRGVRVGTGGRLLIVPAVVTTLPLSQQSPGPSILLFRAGAGRLLVPAPPPPPLLTGAPMRDTACGRGAVWGKALPNSGH